MIRFAAFFAVGIPLTGFFSLLAVAGGPLRASRGWYDWIHRTWSRLLLRIAGIRVETSGLEHLRGEGPRVLVANHQSLFDILALFAVLPISVRFVAKRELSDVPVFAGAMERAGHVFIDRSDRHQAVRAMRRAGERMKREGLSLVLFPEGTRSPDGRLQRFRRGAFSLAIETQADLVPVALEGGGEILPRGRRRLEPGRIRICCAPPIGLEGREREDRDRILRRTRTAISGMLDDLRDRQVGGGPGPTEA